jgi:hypothetical protein
MSKQSPIIIAVDPGKKGSFAVTQKADLSDLKAFKLTTLTDWIAHLSPFTSFKYKLQTKVLVEEVPKTTGSFVPSHTAATLHRNFGELIGAARGLGLSVQTVRPQEWQKGLPGLKGLTGPARKRQLRDLATSRFPHLKPTLQTADALLIAAWANQFFQTIYE